jgi:hypothetical protein
MNIGFFGDSYVDLYWHRRPSEYYNRNIIARPTRSEKPWSLRLLEDLHCPILISGLGGSNQYHAIHDWNNVHWSGQKLDVAIWTFTWHDRLYQDSEGWQEILSAGAERRNANGSVSEAEKIFQALDLYYEFLYNQDQALFLYELQVQWCLKLAELNPDTKFIYLPNTEIARDLCLKNFRDQGSATQDGILVNFAFETLSNKEPGSPGPMPIACGRIGHLNDTNHERFTAYVLDLIKNYEQYRHKVLEFDYGKFDIVDDTI